ncbi:hypothetical protein [Sphingobacterium sp. FBM7-1]|uniref:hypothetical protein n=1 Tax=Sphingobacterium sp. FBM7-1 TaxID=2886688 RepID=UPI001D100BD0|nr:hypothetical protein [Sphingobacterium sp. FBM7-1]MCC2599780.1 hypothetical protein [Sphingobacterium sp. FBM7-1]
MDYTNAYIEGFSNLEFEKLIVRLGLTINLDREIIVFYHYNLKLIYYPNSNILRIKNSLHKYFNSIDGDSSCNNMSDFTLSDARCVAEILSVVYIDRDISDFKISAVFEFGLNVKAPIAPFSIIERYMAYQVHNSINEFTTCEPRKGKPIMRKSYLSDYDLKFYDKGKASELSGLNILRYELVFKQIRKLRTVLGEREVTLETLLEDYNWKKLSDYMIEVYRNIKKSPLLLNNTLDVHQILNIHIFGNKTLKQDLARHLSKSEFNALMKESKGIYTEISESEDDLHNIIERRIHEKLDILSR